MRQDSNERIPSNNLEEPTGWADLLRRAWVRSAYLQKHGRLNDSCISEKFHYTMWGARERYCTEALISFYFCPPEFFGRLPQGHLQLQQERKSFKTLGNFPVAPLLQVMSAAASLLPQTCVSIFPCYFNKLYPYYFRYLQSQVEFTLLYQNIIPGGNCCCLSHPSFPQLLNLFCNF